MIFVTVGTHKQGFERLIKAIDDLVNTNKIKDEVIIQTGYTSYVPKRCKWFKFVPQNEFGDLCRKSDIIITHGGVGSIMTPLKFNKTTIVVPRLKKFNEHADDHQLQIVKELEKMGKIIAVYDIDNLYSAISKAKQFSIKAKKQPTSKIFGIIDEQLNVWDKELNL